jgi:hypothetical protein
MAARELGDLAPAPDRTVVINVGTDVVATRALLSAVEHAPGPVLLVNVEPTPESRAHFARFAPDRGIDVVEAPLRVHGEALDDLFQQLRDDRLLLLDSDAEIRSAELVPWMRAKAAHPEAFGAGFTWGPFLVGADWHAPARAEVLYMERPWMPCVVFDRAVVAEAIAGGASFRAEWLSNEAVGHDHLSRFLGARWGPPWGTRSKTWDLLPSPVQRLVAGRPLPSLRWLRRRRYGVLRPHLVHYDTGGRLYEHLRFERGLQFAATPIELHEGEVHHYLGVTRSTMTGTHAAETSPGSIEAEVIAWMAERYGYEPPRPSPSASSGL